MGFIEQKINNALQPAINKAFKDTFSPIITKNEELRKQKEKEFLEMVKTLNMNMQTLQDNLKELDERLKKVE